MKTDVKEVNEEIAKEDRENDPFLTTPTAKAYFKDPREASIVPDDPVYRPEESQMKTPPPKIEPKSVPPPPKTKEDNKVVPSRYNFGKGNLPVKVTGRLGG